jgi:anaerobic ribonucleoside-triphosphate reductase activating protein
VFVSGISYESLVDGLGVRTTVFFSGCKWNCEGCHNKDTHSFTYGKLFTKDIQNEIITYLKSAKFISGLTLSGGDPMFSAKEVSEFVKEIKRELPDINIWCYTGFKFEDIIKLNDDKFELLKLVDVLVDGKFELDKRDITLKYRGSSNQRILDVQSSLKNNETILYLE